MSNKHKVLEAMMQDIEQTVIEQQASDSENWRNFLKLLDAAKEHGATLEFTPIAALGEYPEWFSVDIVERYTNGEETIFYSRSNATLKEAMVDVLGEVAQRAQEPEATGDD